LATPFGRHLEPLQHPVDLDVLFNSNATQLVRRGNPFRPHRATYAQRRVVLRHLEAAEIGQGGVLDPRLLDWARTKELLYIHRFRFLVVLRHGGDLTDPLETRGRLIHPAHNRPKRGDEPPDDPGIMERRSG
jgi:hypothetical protein